LRSLSFTEGNNVASKQQVLPLSYERRELYRRAGRQFLAVIREVVKAEVKQGDGLAADLEVAPSHLSAALHSSGKNFSVEWLPAVLEVDREHRILRHLAALCEQAVVPRIKLSPEQELELYKRAVESESPAVAAAARRRVYGEDLP
jgi:hypothetical protein